MQDRPRAAGVTKYGLWNRLWVGIGDIESALREKADWILRKLREQQERTQRQLQARIAVLEVMS